MATKRTARARAVKLTTAVGLAGVATIAVAVPAQAWDPARQFPGQCNWRYLDNEGGSNPEITIRYKVSGSVTSSFLNGLRSWDAPLTHVKLVQVTSGWNFEVRAVSNPWGGIAATTRTDQFPSTDNTICSGVEYGNRMPSGKMEIQVLSNLGSYFGTADQFRIGAHEMGHMLGLTHWCARAGAGSGWYYQSIMASNVCDSGYVISRLPSGGPSSLDITDVDGMYAPRIK